jgi:hypothetical protein
MILHYVLSAWTMSILPLAAYSFWKTFFSYRCYLGVGTSACGTDLSPLDFLKVFACTYASLVCPDDCCWNEVVHKCQILLQERIG